MDKFLGIYELLKLNPDNMKSLNRPITSNEIESVTKFPNNRKSRTNDFIVDFMKLLKNKCQFS